MKTRTLLVLALGCGLAIMLAGAVFLFQLAGQDDLEPPVPLGEVATVGDMDVTVDDVSEAAGELLVTVRIGGVDDPDGAGGFRLIASGRPATADASVDGACGATTSEPVASATPCVLAFDVSGADGTSRVLFYERGDDRSHWVLG